MGARILIVEDESIVAMDIQSRLISLGYTVLGITSTGEEALKLAADILPDLVLMDIKLKGKMDGVQAADRIIPTLNIPVIYLTAFADDTTLERAKITEPGGYILKPFKDKELQATIEIALYKHQREKKARENEQRLADTLKNLKEGVIIVDAELHIVFINPAAEKITALSKDEALGHKLTDTLQAATEGGDALSAESLIQGLPKGNATRRPKEIFLLAKNGGTAKTIHCRIIAIPDAQGKVMGNILFCRSAKKKKQAGKDLYIPDDRDMRMLRGIVPICSSCKKIRDTQGDWNQIEVYIQEHSEVKFTHGFCPECMKKLYGNL